MEPVTVSVIELVKRFAKLLVIAQVFDLGMVPAKMPRLRSHELGFLFDITKTMWSRAQTFCIDAGKVMSMAPGLPETECPVDTTNPQGGCAGWDAVNPVESQLVNSAVKVGACMWVSVQCSCHHSSEGFGGVATSSGNIQPKVILACVMVLVQLALCNSAWIPPGCHGHPPIEACAPVVACEAKRAMSEAAALVSDAVAECLPALA